MFSVKQTGVPIGSVIAGLLVPSMLDHAGATAAMGLIAALCLAGAITSQMLRRELDGHRDPAAPLPTMSRLVQPM